MTDEARGLRLGTRGSALAIRQTELVVESLRAAGFTSATEIVVVRTAGDESREPARRLGVGVFTSELEAALRDHRIDLAVHSLKDLPATDSTGVVLGAVLPRADAADALVDREGRRLAQVPAGARVGTSSLRREALLRATRPDVQVVSVRGNVPRRLRLVDDGIVDAVVLAVAGLERLGQMGRMSERLPLDSWLPAPGQGAIAVQAREGDSRLLYVLRSIDDPPTRWATTAERAFLEALQAGCRAPVGACALPMGQGRLALRGSVATLDGMTSITDCLESTVADGHAAAGLGRALAERILRLGARTILANLRAEFDDLHE
ncbi:MAG: hydroxymethylbilane synthase [Vicinamibacterales bacterium]